jgi:hypothetical protein
MVINRKKAKHQLRAQVPEHVKKPKDIMKYYVPRITKEQNEVILEEIQGKVDDSVKDLFIEHNYVKDHHIYKFINLVALRWQCEEGRNDKGESTISGKIGYFDSLTFKTLYDLLKEEPDGKSSKMTTKWNKKWKTTVKIYWEKKQFHKINLVIFGICINSHWSLVIVNIKGRTYIEFDSYSVTRGVGNEKLGTIKRIVDSYYPTSDDVVWKKLDHFKSAKQIDATNCGAFACMNAMCYVMGMNPEKVYSGNDMNLIRRYLTMVYITGTLYEPNSDVCPICYGWYTKSTYDNFLECNKCSRWTHLRCTKRDASEWDRKTKYICLDCKGVN